MLRLCSYAFVLLVLLASLGSGCTTLQPAPDYEAQITELEQQLRNMPDDAEALLDLGALYLLTDQAEAALTPLQRAYTLAPADEKTQFHYGLALEASGQVEDALEVYGQYTAAARLSPYRSKMAARYTRLSRELIREEIRSRLADESTYPEVPDRTLAVFPFVYQGDDERYTPIGRGLAEMLTVDLSQVQVLDVLERVRVQVLLDEMALAAGDAPAVDPATAPRAGRLLGAQRLLTGSYDVLEGERLRLDAAAFAVDGETLGLDSRSDALADFFRLEKDLVFGLLDELGIEPTPGEREAIERVPTRNLQAFLAYSRGLQEEDVGRYGAAAQHFREAQRLDPDFEQAAEQAEVAEAAPEAGTDPSASVDAAAPAPSMTQELVQSRQQNLGGTVGSGFVPGQDNREPATEAAEAGATGLPPPPGTPQRGN